MLADLPTHAAWLTGVFRRKAALLSVAGGKVPTRLTVQSGLMHGMSEAFASDVLKIGSGPGSDIVLLDDDILPLHVTIQLRRSVFGVLANMSAFGPVIVGDQTIDAGQGSDFLRLPQDIHIAGATVTLAYAPETAAREYWLQGTAGFVGIVSFVLALVLAAPLVQLLLHSPGQNTGKMPQSAAQAAENRKIATQTADTGSFLDTMNSEIARLGLAGNLVIASPEGNLISITGRIPAAKWQDWRSFTTWYDQQAHAPVLVQDVAQAAELAQLKAVAMIRLTTPEEIIFADGQTRKVGQVVADDWLIKSIAAKGLVLTRGDETTEIAF